MKAFKARLHGNHHDANQEPGHGTTSPPDYLPPSGPPPAQRIAANQDEKPPLGPPPSYAAVQDQDPSREVGQQQPNHDWTSVPDTSLLPPPPSLHSTLSPSGNANEDDAVRAHRWCDQYPLNVPRRPTEVQAATVRKGAIILQKPREYNGKLESYGAGLWKSTTFRDARDCCVLSSMPMYFAEIDNPLKTRQEKTIYFEVKVLAVGTPSTTGESSLAIGYCAVPYPTWRMPGWERGSFAVHSDDGRRYISDTEGGIEFTSRFRAGETIGLGVKFTNPPMKSKDPNDTSRRSPDGDVFFTRNGKKAGNWDIHEEMDSSNEFGTLGIDGKYDLFAAIGVYGSVGYEAIFDPKHWQFHP